MLPERSSSPTPWGGFLRSFNWIVLRSIQKGMRLCWTWWTILQVIVLYYGLFMYNKNAMEQLERLDLAFEALKKELFGHLHEILRKQLFGKAEEEGLRGRSWRSCPRMGLHSCRLARPWRMLVTEAIRKVSLVLGTPVLQ
ncbi:Arogenate dehydrogenase 2, chloroplastic [Sesamum angolense]|uniref:Arogenate dehydrogenase 2, chloroplastic n=1 Tax=Sesamum angolense TaxID=2727404 RepID=A0AAE1X3L5_9LAMI|nr:Arogenate dehydrogenase 2, chloroplastic [Sesamum angolense]